MQAMIQNNLTVICVGFSTRLTSFGKRGISIVGYSWAVGLFHLLIPKSKKDYFNLLAITRHVRFPSALRRLVSASDDFDIYYACKVQFRLRYRHLCQTVFIMRIPETTSFNKQFKSSAKITKFRPKVSWSRGSWWSCCSTTERMTKDIACYSSVAAVGCVFHLLV